MKILTLIVFTITAIWSIFSWHWYTCKIKWFCTYANKNETITTPTPQLNNKKNPITITEKSEKNQKTEETKNKNPIQKTEKTTTKEPPLNSAKIKDTTKTPCKDIITKPISINSSKNIEKEVKLLEQFLIEHENEKLTIDWIYTKEDIEAIKRLQLKYSEDILKPWGITQPTWYVYKTTIEKINSLNCSE